MRANLVSLKGDKGDDGEQGPRGFPGVNGVSNDNANATLINTTSATREALDNLYLQKRDYERPLQLTGQPYLAFCDSYGTTVGTVPSYLAILTTDFGLQLTNRSGGGRYFQDGAIAGWGSAQTIPAGKPSTSFTHIAFGINPMLQQRGLDPVSRRAEMDALEALIWMMCAESFTSNDAWAKTGTWPAYSNTAMKNSSAYVADAAGAYGVFTPPAGDYVGMGFSYTDAAPGSVLAGTGVWKKNSATVQANNYEKAPAPIVSGLTFTPRPVRLMGLTGTDVIRVDSVANQFTFLDEMIKLGEPPFIVIVKPVYVLNAYAPNSTVDICRGDIDAKIAGVIAAYPKLKGKIINVDPVLNGWDASKHLQSDGVHPNLLGTQMIEECTKRAIYRTAKAREVAITLGIL